MSNQVSSVKRLGVGVVGPLPSLTASPGRLGSALAQLFCRGLYVIIRQRIAHIGRGLKLKSDNP